MALIAAVVVTCLAGWAVIGRWARCGWLSGVALSYAAGAGVLSLELFFFGLAHLPWNAAVILLPWAPLLYLDLRRRRPRWEVPPCPNWLEWIAIAACAAAPLAWLPYERVMPLNTQNWDSWAIWLFKARAFYLEGNVGGFLARAGEFNCQPSYPLLIPLYDAFIYSLAGTPAEFAAKAADSPCFFFSLLGAFFHLANRFTGRTAAFVFTAMLANLHMVNIVAFELAGYADTALSVYMLLGAGFLYAWWKEDDSRDLALASLFSSLAAWTKNEGMFFLAGVGLLVLLRLIVRRHSQRRSLSLAPAAVWPAVAVLPWFVVRRLYGVPGSDLLGGAPVAWRNLTPALGSILSQAARISVYNLTFWLLPASFLLARLVRMDSRWWMLPGLALWQFAGLLFAYLSGRNDIQWWIGTSLDRILAQVAPLALLAPAPVIHKWIEMQSQQQAAGAVRAAAQPPPRRNKRKR